MKPLDHTNPLRSRVLHRLRVRARFRMLLDGLSVLCLTAVVLAMSSFAIDRTLHLERGFRAVLAGLAALTLAGLAVRRLVLPLRLPLTDDELALAMERADHHLAQQLISAVQFETLLAEGKTRGDSPELMGRVVVDTAAQAPRLLATDPFDTRRLRFSVWTLVLVLGVITAGFAAAADTISLWARRNVLLSGTEWPRATELAFQGLRGDGTLRVPEREDLTVEVLARKLVPEQVRLLLTSKDGEVQDMAMAQTGLDRFVFTVPMVLEDLVVRAVGGDGDTGEVRVVAVPRPRLVLEKALITAPGYLGAGESRLDPTTGEVAVPDGGTLTLTVASDKPLRQAALLLDGVVAGDVTVTMSPTGTPVQFRFTPPRSAAIGFQVLDEDGLDAVDPPLLSLRIVADQAPAVRYQVTGVGSLLTPFARIPGQLELEDDHGVVSVQGLALRTVVAGEGEPPPFAPAPFTGLDTLELPGRSVSAQPVLDLRDWNAPDGAPFVQPGDLLMLRFRAADGRPDPGTAPAGGEGDGVFTTEPIMFRIVTRDRLLEDMMRRRLEQRRDLQLTVDGLLQERASLAAAGIPTAAGTGEKRPEDVVGRRQTSIQQTLGVAERYDMILQELANNRVAEADELQKAMREIVAPLRLLANEAMVSSVQKLEDFVARQASASPDAAAARDAALVATDAVITGLRAVLAQMADLESLQGLLETLRQVQRLQDEVLEQARLRLEEDAGSIFDPQPVKPRREDGR